MHPQAPIVSTTPLISWSCIRQEILKIVVYNTAIAILFSLTVQEEPFWRSWVFSQCIGLSIYGGVRLSCAIRRTHLPALIDALTGILPGFMVGLWLGCQLTGINYWDLVTQAPAIFITSGVSALIFGSIGTYHFRREALMYESQAEIEKERNKRLELEASATRTELAALQAQIEPHFLFNTLSNVISLIDPHPDDARTMLLHLTTLLRTSLLRTRRPSVTVREELELLRAYLSIMQIRMGERLQWHIDCPPMLESYSLPPLLVQPLVENAIRHGLEPKPEGGMIRIECAQQDNHLTLSITDNGLGFHPDGEHGIGLSNIRQRLAACFGQQAGLRLENPSTGGMRAVLSLPLERVS